MDVFVRTQWEEVVDKPRSRTRGYSWVSMTPLGNEEQELAQILSGK